MFFNEILKKSYKNKNFKCNDKNIYIVRCRGGSAG